MTDREYAQAVLKGGYLNSSATVASALARRLLAALEREEKLREALDELLEAAEAALNGMIEPEDLRASTDKAFGVLDQDVEPHGNFSDTQDTNPRGGC